MHSWQLQFSKKNVLSLTMDFPDITKHANKYKRRIVRPLFVVLITSPESFDQFIYTTQNVDMSFPIWLIIFMPYLDNPFHDFCEYPKENIFNVKFSTEMLVFCYGHTSLKEWYAVRDNLTRTFELAHWTPTTGLQLTTNESLYHRRDNMFGDTLKIATVAYSPFSTVKDGKLFDLFGEVLGELSRGMNFKMEIMPSVEGYGSYNKEMGKWTGVIGELVSGQADVGVAEFTMTTSRLDVVDFTLPLLLSKNRLYIRGHSNASVQWSAYFQAFKSDIWSVIVVLIITTPILLTVMKTRGVIAARIISENYILVWGIYCQQGLSEFPTNSSLRLAYFSIFISALIVSSAYSASLISFLTVTTTTLPFNTLEEFAAARSYKLAVYKHSAEYDMFMNTQDKVLQEMSNLLMPRDELPIMLFGGFKYACTKKVAFYTTEVMLKTINRQLPCKIYYIESGRIDSLAMALVKGSPYTGLINYHLQRFRDNGMLNKLKGNHHSKAAMAESRHDAVGLWGIAPILAVLAGGIILGIFLLLLEKLHYLCGEERKKTRVSDPDNQYTNHPDFLIKKKTKIEALTELHATKHDIFEKHSIGYWP
ncbi:glutamate receptor ionotropic, delta-2-like [Prorops nasuta]|uniref:glutamate receptor ionotropic, delta-2-like n=1 Tax=Prorops nasuta TaxID=863751 RepID=UPI0034D017FB